MAADNGAGVADGVAADLNIVAQHRAEFFDPGLDFLGAVMDDNELLIRLDVRGDGAGAHVGIVAEDRVAYIVVVRGLNVIEEDDVLQLRGVADHTVGADESRAADEGALAHLGVGADDARSAEISGVKDLGGLVHPHLRRTLLIIVAQRRAESDDHVLDALERFPRICKLREIVLREGVIKVIQIFDSIHYSLSFFSMSRKYL